MEKITSRDNRRLVHARKVRDGKTKEHIFIEGRRLVYEAIRSDLVIEECFVSDDFVDYDLLNAIEKQNLSVVRVANRLFDSIADTKRSQGIIVIAKRPSCSLEKIEKNLRRSSLPIIVFLKEINNASNLGAITRTAEAAGVAGLIVSRNSADVYSPKALRGAMGSAFRLPILESADLENTILWAKTVRLVSSAAAATGASSYIEMDWRKPRLLIFGSEAHGFSDSEMETVDEVLNIPMENGVESLNLAVSAAVILFEARRQHVSGSV